MKTKQPVKLLAGFPGVGKSSVKEQYKMTDQIIIDLDSSAFSWIIEDGKKVRNPHFIEDYIHAIKKAVETSDIVMISTHAETLKRLETETIPFFVVLPAKNRKEEFLNNYKKRGNQQTFIDLIETHWDEWLNDANEMYKNKPNTNVITLVGSEFMDDAVERTLNLNSYD